MSAAVNRATKLAPSTNESTRPAETSSNRNLGGPAAEVPEISAADRGPTGDHGMTPLMRAACDGLAGTVRALLDRGDEVNAQRSDGFNALALAAFFGHSQVVWLLLENGAAMAATGRSETPPDRWADARGYFAIAETLREARVREQVEVSSPSNAVIDESARFSRSAEKEQSQRTGDLDPGAEATVIAEATDFEVTLATGRALDVEREGTARETESTADALSTHQPEQQAVIEHPPRTSKTLPEIEDPPPLMVPKFHPGSVFVARIISSRKNLVILILAALLVGSASGAILFPQIRQSLVEWQNGAVSNTTNLPAQPTYPVVAPATNVSAMEAPAAPATEPTNAPDLKVIEETKTAAFAAATSLSRSAIRTRKHRAISRAVEFKQELVVEEKPKPAPLSVETSRRRSVLPTPAGSAHEVSNGPEPMGIISGKPKSKVIQWP